MAELEECGAIYNVACGVPTSIDEIVEIYLSLARECSIEVRVLSVEGQRWSVQKHRVSNAKLRALGWEARETIGDAIRDQLNAERTHS